MPINKLAHFSVRTTALDASRRFYCNVLGFQEGFRPPFDFPGIWLYRGGDGICREYEFLEPLTVSLLSERRRSAPFGLAGGEPGAMGRNLHNGSEVPGHASLQVAAGDHLRIETPGGGGYGTPER